MKSLLALSVCLLIIAGAAALAADPPKEIVFESKYGAVKYDHANHVKYAEDDCTACHPKLFPQSREPIKFKGSMHRKAEKAMSSCAGCHYPKGSAFSSKGNCYQCHTKK